MPEARTPDDLYGLPAEAFVPARRALERRLRAEGRTDEAKAVARLRKPTRTAAAINRAVRSSPEDATALVRAAETLRVASRLVMSGGGADQLRAAQRDERRALDRLLGLIAREIGTGGGLAAARLTLVGLARGDEEARETLLGGRIDHELESADESAWGGEGALAVLLGGSGTSRGRRARSATPRPRTRRSKGRSAGGDSAAEKRRAGDAKREEARRRQADRQRRAAAKREARRRAMRERKRVAAARALENAERRARAARAKAERAEALARRLRDEATRGAP